MFTAIINVLVTPFTYPPIKPGIVDVLDGRKSSSVPLFRIMPQEGIVLLPSTWHVIFLGELMGIYNGPVGVKSTKIQQQQQLKIVYSNVSFNCYCILWYNWSITEMTIAQGLVLYTCLCSHSGTKFIFKCV